MSRCEQVELCQIANFARRAALQEQTGIAHYELVLLVYILEGSTASTLRPSAMTSPAHVISVRASSPPATMLQMAKCDRQTMMMTSQRLAMMMMMMSQRRTATRALPPSARCRA